MLGSALDISSSGSALDISSSSADKSTGALVNIAQTGALVNTSTQEAHTQVLLYLLPTAHASAGIASFTGDATAVSKLVRLL